MGWKWGVERTRWIFIVLERCEGNVLSLRQEGNSRLIAGQFFFHPSFLKGCTQVTPEHQRVLVKVFSSYDYIYQASEGNAQRILRSQVKRFQNHSSLKNRPAIFFPGVYVCMYIQDVKILFAFPGALNREWNSKQNMSKNIGSETHNFRLICQMRRTNERPSSGAREIWTQQRKSLGSSAPLGAR